MAWSRSARPKDPDALRDVLLDGSYDEFVAAYDPRWINYEYDGYTLLTLALRNKDLQARCDIASRLLDDGVDVTRWQPLHRLLSQRTHDFSREPDLLRRMIEAGADVNEVVPRQGAPIEALASVFPLSDDQLAPFYDVLFAAPLDLQRHGKFGKPIIDALRLKPDSRPDLIRRAERYSGVA